MEKKLITLSIGKPKKYTWNGVDEASAIGKEVVDKASLTMNGFIGDEVANTEFHGGPDRAVCLYSYEHYQKWQNEFNKSFFPPAFGENICVSGMQENEVYIGEIYQLGDAVVQICQGRIPCSKISKHHKVPLLLNRIVETGFTGYFFRVLEEGEVDMDSSISLLERPQETMTILKANHIMFHDKKNKQAISSLLEVKELAEVWQKKLEKML